MPGSLSPAEQPINPTAGQPPPPPGHNARLQSLESSQVTLDTVQTINRAKTLRAADTDANIFVVQAKGTGGTPASRFIIENNLNTPEIDIDFMGATVNVGRETASEDPGGSRLIFLAPTIPDSGNAIIVMRPGQNPNGGQAAMYVGRQGQINAYPYGVTSVYYSLFAPTEAQPRFRIGEGDAGGIALRWGPGGAVATDTDLFRGGIGQLRTNSQIAVNGNDVVARIGAISEIRSGAVGPAGEAAIRFSSFADASIFRSEAATLKTVGNFHVASDLRHLGANLGLFNAAPAAKQAVTGSRGANAALASLLTGLAAYGLITDSSIP